MWTRFMDMHSGGGCKLDWEYIYIEAPEEEAIEVFSNKFGRDPEDVTCDCCGPDYCISEYDTLEEATRYDVISSLEEYLERDDVFVMNNVEIGLDMVLEKIL
jgi:hypothetical protein